LLADNSFRIISAGSEVTAILKVIAVELRETTRTVAESMMSMALEMWRREGSTKMIKNVCIL